MMEALLNVNEVAAYLGVHPKTIYRFKRERGFPVGIMKFGSRRWLRAEVLEWMGLSEEKVSTSNVE